MKLKTIKPIPPSPETELLEQRAFAAFSRQREYWSLPYAFRPDPLYTITVAEENRLYIYLCAKDDEIAAVYRVTNRGPLKRIKHGPLRSMGEIKSGPGRALEKLVAGKFKLPEAA